MFCNFGGQEVKVENFSEVYFSLRGGIYEMFKKKKKKSIFEIKNIYNFIIFCVLYY